MKEKIINFSGFIKVGKQDHIEALQKRGLLHLNTIKFHRENNENSNRDTREGSYNNIPLAYLKLFRNGKEIPTKFISGRLNEFLPENLLHHIYCFYTINNVNLGNGYFVDNRMIEFGMSSLIITDTNEFIDRLTKKLKQLPFNSQAQFINYFDWNSKHEKTDAFDKPNVFEHENEFRILVMGHTEATLQIELGSIQDISIIIESKDLLKLSIETESIEK